MRLWVQSLVVLCLKNSAKCLSQSWASTFLKHNGQTCHPPLFLLLQMTIQFCLEQQTPTRLSVLKSSNWVTRGLGGIASNTIHPTTLKSKSSMVIKIQALSTSLFHLKFCITGDLVNKSWVFVNCFLWI
jgi:hypothetical protein